MYSSLCLKENDHIHFGSSCCLLIPHIVRIRTLPCHSVFGAVMLKTILVATLMAVPALASVKCTTPNSWLNPATGETGACISNDAGVSYTWHCPWESGGLVVGFGCKAVMYDCTAPIAQLLQWYTSHMASKTTFDATPAEEGYTVLCIKHQCQGGPDPGDKPARRLLTV